MRRIAFTNDGFVARGGEIRLFQRATDDHAADIPEVVMAVAVCGERELAEIIDDLALRRGNIAARIHAVFRGRTVRTAHIDGVILQRIVDLKLRSLLERCGKHALFRIEEIALFRLVRLGRDRCALRRGERLRLACRVRKIALLGIDRDRIVDQLRILRRNGGIRRQVGQIVRGLIPCSDVAALFGDRGDILLRDAPAVNDFDGVHRCAVRHESDRDVVGRGDRDRTLRGVGGIPHRRAHGNGRAALRNGRHGAAVDRCDRFVARRPRQQRVFGCACRERLALTHLKGEFRLVEADARRARREQERGERRRQKRSQPKPELFHTSILLISFL